MSWLSRVSLCAPSARRGYTLVEVLVVVTILGVAGLMVVPTLGQTDVLRVQGAVRTIVADLTFAQSDALAYQEERAIVFDVAENQYTLCGVFSETIDPATDALFDPRGPNQQYVVDFDDPAFGNSQIAAPDFDDDGVIIFDALGGPILSPGSDVPGSNGTVDVIGASSRMRITVEAFTGHITVAEVPLDGGGN